MVNTRYIVVYKTGREKTFSASSLIGVFKKIKGTGKVNKILTGTEDIASFRRARTFYKWLNKN